MELDDYFFKLFVNSKRLAPSKIHDITVNDVLVELDYIDLIISSKGRARIKHYDSMVIHVSLSESLLQDLSNHIKEDLNRSLIYPDYWNILISVPYNEHLFALVKMRQLFPKIYETIFGE